ncbi:MAG: peptide chain release factor N(5)-glutamine methyltransferase [Pseudomonadota bacterium]
MASIRKTLQKAREQLGGETPGLDAQLLLCHVLEKPHSYLIAHAEEPLSDAQKQQLEPLLARRAAGEPIAHILGQQEFWSLPFTVTADTLIPRPDTECLVEAALALLPAHLPAGIADLGAGSGCIGLSLASERPKSAITLVERSAPALAVIEQNIRQLGLDNARAIAGSWCEPLAGQAFDLIISNPPYVCANDRHLSQGDVRFEPESALVAGEDGLDDIRTLVRQVPDHLKPGGHFIVEFGYDQSAAVETLLRGGGFCGLRAIRDFGGHIRGFSARKPERD